MRVLVTGMGGELGTRVAQILEERTDVAEIVGVDLVPPRRRLRRAQFRRIDPRDRDRLSDFVTEVAPDTVIHYGIYEPHSRLGPRDAAHASIACTITALGAAARTGALARVAVRSSLAVYGRGRGRPGVPDEGSPFAPSSGYGRTCLEVEALSASFGRRLDIPICALRMAPVAGSHSPSPLGRILRLPVVPVPAFADPAFCLLHQEDAARAMVEAVVRDVDGPINLVGPGAVSVWQAVRLGGRIPLPVAGPGWGAAREYCELSGAPVPNHVQELLRRGCAADGSRAASELGLGDMTSTRDVCTEIYEWATVTPLRPEQAVA